MDLLGSSRSILLSVAASLLVFTAIMHVRVLMFKATLELERGVGRATMELEKGCWKRAS